MIYFLSLQYMTSKLNIFGYILIFFIIGTMVHIYLQSDHFNLKCIISNKDGNTYCVRERLKIQLVADLLANVTTKLKKLVVHMVDKYPDRENVIRLKNNFNPKKIYETLPTSQYTAYSENKGEKLAFCVTKQKNGHDLIDINTLTFVGIHELGHCMSKKIGHGDEFWQNFRFLLENAVKIGIYHPKDYKKKNVTYCGMQITDNPYYDL